VHSTVDMVQQCVLYKYNVKRIKTNKLPIAVEDQYTMCLYWQNETVSATKKSSSLRHSNYSSSV